LRALATQGPSAVKKLRGMFAFAQWDDRSRRLTTARDPLGIKPLYIRPNPDPDGSWSLLLAAEVRALLASGLLGKPKVNRAAVASVVWRGFVAGPDTIVEGITSLLPGEIRELDGSAAERSREVYWQMPRDERKGLTVNELREAL